MTLHADKKFDTKMIQDALYANQYISVSVYVCISALCSCILTLFRRSTAWVLPYFCPISVSHPLSFQDLGSAHGTVLGGIRLKPHEPLGVVLHGWMMLGVWSYHELFKYVCNIWAPIKTFDSRDQSNQDIDPWCKGTNLFVWFLKLKAFEVDVSNVQKHPVQNQHASHFWKSKAVSKTMTEWWAFFCFFVFGSLQTHAKGEHWNTYMTPCR